MAGLTGAGSPERNFGVSAWGGGQFAAVALVRWQTFVHSLRTGRGRANLVSRIIMGSAYAVIGIGGAMGLGSAAHAMALPGRDLRWFAALLWPVFLFWQIFPVLATSVNEQMDAAELLRFPLRYPTYFLIRLAHGVLDPVPILGTLWLVAITVGIGIARPALIPWAAASLLSFALLNVLLSRAIFAWLERWLAKRRTREILGFLTLLLMMSLQLLGPLMEHLERPATPGLARMVRIIAALQTHLPPGLAAKAVSLAAQNHWLSAMAQAGLLWIWLLVIAWLLDLRVRAQYRGENLSESPHRAATAKPQDVRRTSWDLPGLSGPVSAVLEKELRYFFRSGPMLFNLIVPFFMLLLFRGTLRGGGGLLARHADLAFPIGVIYTLTLLANTFYNSLGADGAAVQLYLSLPVHVRQVVVGKNLAHSTVLVLETILIWGFVALLYGPPSLEVTMATLAGLLFAAPADLAVGNLLSFQSPRRVDSVALGRQRLPQSSTLAGLLVHAALFGIGMAVFQITGRTVGLWLATPIFLGLAVFSWVGYFAVLGQLDRRPLSRHEALLSELCKG